MLGSLENKIFDINSNEEFEKTSLKVFKYQYENNPIYKTFCDYLKRNPSNVVDLKKIPFLPITFFKSKKIVSTDSKVQTIFTSSGTTGQQTSKHYVTNLDLYRESFMKAFRTFLWPSKRLLYSGSFTLLFGTRR